MVGTDTQIFHTYVMVIRKQHFISIFKFSFCISEDMLVPLILLNVMISNYFYFPAKRDNLIFLHDCVTFMLYKCHFSAISFPMLCFETIGVNCKNRVCLSCIHIVPTILISCLHDLCTTLSNMD